MIPYTSQARQISYSPDGRRYLLRIARGDLARNGVWTRFVTGLTTSFSAATPIDAAVLFSPAYGENPVTYNNQPRWLEDNESVAFLWEDERAAQQVVALNLSDGKITQRTHHKSGVSQFALSSDARTLVYAAFENHDSSTAQHMIEQGFAVASAYAPSFLTRNLDGWLEWYHVELLLDKGDGNSPIKLTLPGGLGAGALPVVEFSADGRRVIVALPVNPPVSWNVYRDRNYKTILAQAHQEPVHPSVYQLHVVDTRTAVVRPLWNALWAYGSPVSWTSDGTSIVTGPTFLPPDDPSIAGLNGRAFAKVNVATGRHQVLAEGKYNQQRARRTASKPARVQMELRQDPNVPPLLYATDSASGGQRILLDLAPELRSRFRLGEVRLFRWSDQTERKWTGKLYLPVGECPAKRWPLVIQLKPFSPTEFSLSGSEDYPSTFVAQVLSNRCITTLQMEEPDAGIREVSASPEEPKVVLAGILSAIDHLALDGLIDRSRVGLSGFSRTGWFVEYALTHTEFPFAAALAADHINASYDQAMLWAWPDEYTSDIGAEPFGSGLSVWLRESPGFNADRVKAPLRLQVHTQVTSALGHWEMFSRLKQLRRPVELYIVPNADKAAHNLQNPSQLLASREGAVDWFEFWLNDKEDDDRSKVAQYLRWRNLRILRDALTGAKVLERTGAH